MKRQASGPSLPRNGRGNWLIVIPMALVMLTWLAFLGRGTLAINRSSTVAGGGLQAMSATKALEFDPLAVNLGDVTATQPIGGSIEVKVSNLSGRTLTLSASVVGVEGLSASLDRTDLPGGESAVAAISGAVANSGPVNGSLQVTAMGGFLTGSIPITGYANEFVAPVQPEEQAPTQTEEQAPVQTEEQAPTQTEEQAPTQPEEQTPTQADAETSA